MDALSIFQILLGIALLLFGRSLFWLFTSVSGFIFGLRLAYFFWGQEQSILIWFVALFCGMLGAVLASFLYKSALGITGFISSVYAITQMMNFFHIHIAEPGLWLVYLLVGVIGALLLIFLFDWTLIILSASVGAALITGYTDFGFVADGFLFAFLMLVGVFNQAGWMWRSSKKIHEKR